MDHPFGYAQTGQLRGGGETKTRLGVTKRSRALDHPPARVMTVLGVYAKCGDGDGGVERVRKLRLQ